MISSDDFKKIELLIGTVLSAERVEGSDKLLKLRVSLGAEGRRIIAGIGRKYAPDALAGRQIVIVANLEPRMIMGLESRGMLLAADSTDGPVLLQPDGDVVPGASIK